MTTQWGKCLQTQAHGYGAVVDPDTTCTQPEHWPAAEQDQRREGVDYITIRPSPEMRAAVLAAAGLPDLTQHSASRFALDEEKAREWLARRDGIEEYQPAMSDDGSDTWHLVTEALEAGVIADAIPLGIGCPSLVFEYIPDGDGDGYRWILYHDAASDTITATPIEGMSGLGGGYDAKGAEAALDVLREAVREGNALLSRLDRYVSSLPLAVRAPEAAGVISRCQRFASEPDEHANGLASPRAVLARKVLEDLGVPWAV